MDMSKRTRPENQRAPSPLLADQSAYQRPGLHRNTRIRVVDLDHRQQRTSANLAVRTLRTSDFHEQRERSRNPNPGQGRTCHLPREQLENSKWREPSANHLESPSTTSLPSSPQVWHKHHCTPREGHHPGTDPIGGQGECAHTGAGNRCQSGRHRGPSFLGLRKQGHFHSHDEGPSHAPVMQPQSLQSSQSCRSPRPSGDRAPFPNRR